MAFAVCTLSSDRVLRVLVRGMYVSVSMGDTCVCVCGVGACEYVYGGVILCCVMIGHVSTGHH